MGKIIKHCTIGALATVPAGAVIADSTVVLAGGMMRRDARGAAELQARAQAREIELLRRLIPNKAEKFMAAAAAAAATAATATATVTAGV